MPFNALAYLRAKMNKHARVLEKYLPVPNQVRGWLAPRRDTSTSLRIPYPDGYVLRSDLFVVQRTHDSHADVQQYLEYALPRILPGLRAEVAALRTSNATHSLLWDMQEDIAKGLSSVATQVLATAAVIIGQDDPAGDTLVGTIFCTFIDTHFKDEVCVAGDPTTGYVMLQQL